MSQPYSSVIPETTNMYLKPRHTDIFVSLDSICIIYSGDYTKCVNI